MVKTVKIQTPRDRKIEVKKYRDVKFQSVRVGNDSVPVYAPEYGFNFLDYMLDEIKEAVKKDFDRNILITGPEGGGKSALAAWLATELGMSDEKNACQRPQDYIESVRDADYGGVTWLDEGTQGLYNRDAMKGINKKLNKAFALFRMKNLTNLICIPHKNILDSGIRNRRVHYWGSVEPQGYSRGFVKWHVAGKKSRLFNHDSKKPRKPILYNRWKIGCFWEPLAYMRFPKFRENNGFDWDTYEEIKGKNLDATLEEMAEEDDRSQMENAFIKTVQHMKNEEGLEVGEIADRTGYSEPSIYRFLNTEPEEVEDGEESED